MAVPGAGAMPSSSWPMPSCALRGPSDRCPPSASSPSSAAPTAAFTRRSSAAGSTRTDFGRSSWRSARFRGRSSLPSTPRRGTAVTPSAAPSGAFTIRHRNIQQANPSWPAGPISGSVSWTGPLTRGPHPSTWRASRPSATPPRRRQNRSAASLDFSATMEKSRCSSSTPATTRSPSVTIWPKSVVNASLASATTASFTPIPLPVPTDRPRQVDVPHGTDGASSARIRRPGRGHRRGRRGA